MNKFRARNKVTLQFKLGNGIISAAAQEKEQLKTKGIDTEAIDQILKTIESNIEHTLKQFN